MTLDTIDPHDWATAAPHFAALASEEVTAQTVGGWLGRWSDLEKTLAEAGAQAYRAKSEDTTDQAAEAAYLHFVQQIVPPWTVAAQALKTKLLAVPDFAPEPDQVQFLRRLRSDAELFRDANVPIQAQLQTLTNNYDKITGPMTVTLGGEELTLPQAEQRGADTDRSRLARKPGGRCRPAGFCRAVIWTRCILKPCCPCAVKLAQNAGLPDLPGIYVARAEAASTTRPPTAWRSATRLPPKPCRWRGRYLEARRRVARGRDAAPVGPQR